jgi:DNA-binding SARP family transcriptional activator/tetratricopeptide (TPR) repeat protein
LLVEFRLLGPVEAWARSRRLDLGPPQQRAVLAALLMDAGRLVMADTLIDRVWDQRPPAGARRALHVHIARIRQALRQENAAGAPPALLHRSGGYQLDVDVDLVDWHRFRHLTGTAAQDRLAESDRARLLREALGLWRGTPLADVAGDWAARTRENCRQQRLDVAVAWADAALRLGHHHDVIGPARDLAAEYPLAESLVAALMRALVAAGRHSEALDCYAATRARLVDELGSEPGPELQDLHLALLRGHLPSPAGTATVGSPTADPGRGPAQLPPDVRGFAGRDDELARLDLVLDTAGTEPGAVVISAVSGTPGVGKTALAIRWAHRVRQRFPDGQLYVNLRGFDADGHVMSPADAVRGFLDALGVPPEAVPPNLDAQVEAYHKQVAGKRILVVLDNARDAEHVRRLLPGTSSALAVVTSRNRLTPLVVADGAQPIVLDLLSTVESRDLLARRLGFDRVAAEADAVDEIVDACARLPLALVIAGARAQQTGFPLAAVAAELDQIGRLDSLDAGDATSQIRGVFSWSYAALTPPAGRLFRLLGLASGPDIGPTAAASLTGSPVRETRRQLSELTNASLLTEHIPGRFTFHDLLRDYAADLAQTHDSEHHRRAALTRLLDYYTHTAHSADRLLHPLRDPIVIPLTRPATGSQPERLDSDQAAMEWMRAEHLALVAALRQADEAGLDAHAWQLAWALDTFLGRQGDRHGRVTAWRTALRAAQRLGDWAAQADAHRLLGVAQTRLGRYEDAQVQLGHALHLYVRGGDRLGQANTHRSSAFLCEFLGEPERALDHAQRALALYQAAGHDRGRAAALNAVGWCFALVGNHAEAIPHCEQALTVLQQLGDRDGEAATWDSLGFAHHHLGQHQRAAECFRRSIDMYRELGNRSDEANTLANLGDTYHAVGEPDAARGVWERALDILTDLDLPDAEVVRTKIDRLDRP